MKTFVKYIVSIFILLAFIPPAKAQELNTSINTVITDYISLKNALVTVDGNAAEIKAKALLAAVTTVPLGKMNTKQLAVWNKYLAKLQFDSRHISEVNRIEHQREHFASLSNNIYEVIRAFKVNQTVIYREYCRMNKQYYLSETGGGKDPYMSMALCSKVVETLPAVK